MAKEAKEKKGGKKRLVIKIVAVTAALGLLFMMEKGKIIKPHYGPGHGRYPSRGCGLRNSRTSRKRTRGSHPDVGLIGK